MQDAFIEAFCIHGVIAAACREAGVGRTTVWQWRQDDEFFAKRFDEAEQVAFEALVKEARRRAEQGYDEYVVSGGRLVKDDQGNPLLQRRYSDQLLKYLIERREGKPVQTIEHRGDGSKPAELEPQLLAEVLKQLDRLGGVAPGEAAD